MTMNHIPEELLPIGNLFYPGRVFSSSLQGFGLGFSVITDVPGSLIVSSKGTYGWAGAANTFFWIDPEEELIGIMMMNFFPSPSVNYPIEHLFRTLVYQAIND